MSLRPGAVSPVALAEDGGRQAATKSPLPPIFSGSQTVRSPSPSTRHHSPPAAEQTGSELHLQPPTSPHVQSHTIVIAPNVPSPITDVSVPPCPIVLVFGT